MNDDELFSRNIESPSAVLGFTGLKDFEIDSLVKTGLSRDRFSKSIDRDLEFATLALRTVSQLDERLPPVTLMPKLPDVVGERMEQAGQLRRQPEGHSVVAMLPVLQIDNEAVAGGRAFNGAAGIAGQVLERQLEPVILVAGPGRVIVEPFCFQSRRRVRKIESRSHSGEVLLLSPSIPSAQAARCQKFHAEEASRHVGGRFKLLNIDEQSAILRSHRASP